MGATSLARRKKMLQKVATTGADLDSAYTQTLQRIRDQKGDRSRLGIEVLMWVSHAERPLGIDELRYALAVEMGSTDLDPDNIPPQDTVLGSCLGLAVVDAETSTVRLIHYTLQEYLSSPGIMPDAHKTLGQTCLTYLNYKQVKELPAKKILTFEDMPFLQYSSLHWGSHAKVELPDRAKSLALEPLNQAGNHISATLLVEQISALLVKRVGYPHSFSLPYHLWPALHCASYFGIIEVVTALMERGGCDINQNDCMGFAPFIHAAWQGDEGVVQLLLTWDDINLDKPDNNGGTPLWWASYYAHVGVVKLLLARDDINPDKPDKGGQTPLWWVSFHGYEGVAKLLLARDDVNPDKPNNDGVTPLWRASSIRHEGMAKLLLTRDDINPNKPNSDGETPLWWASSNEHEWLVKLLLARNDVNPNKPDMRGVTPLAQACNRGHEGIVKLLLKRDDINPNMNMPQYPDQTPLLWASFDGHPGIVKLLLAHKDLDPNSIYEAYQMLTRLSLHKEVAELLKPRAASVSRLISKNK